MLMKNPLSIDRSYTVSLATLREVLKAISNESVRWWVAAVREAEKAVVVGYSNPEPSLPNSPVLASLNRVFYIFPIVNRIPLLSQEEGLMVCLNCVSAEQSSQGLYMEDNQFKHDVVEDWEKFWVPMEAALEKAYSSGAGGVSSK